jgi:ferredoxin
MPTIYFEDKQYTVRAGQELLTAYRINPELPLRFGCCDGNCGTCAIEVIEGYENLSKMGEKEKGTLASKKLAFPHRLACQCAITGNIRIKGREASLGVR